MLAAAAAIALAAPGHAVEVIWADWESNTNTVATGTLATDTPITVEFESSEGFHFVQTGDGINYWTEGNPAPYTSGSVDNAPTPSELISLKAQGTKTISFSTKVSGIYLAFLSSGTGYFGLASNITAEMIYDEDIYSITNRGEAHGILYFAGTFSELSFTTFANETWHSFTVGIKGAAPTPPTPGPGGDVVPEPATWGLMIAGLGLVGRHYAAGSSLPSDLRLANHPNKRGW